MVYKSLLVTSGCTAYKEGYKRILHITHNDGDAVGCALVVDMIEDAISDTFFCATGNGVDSASDVLMDVLSNNTDVRKYTDVIISDVSIRDDVAERVDEYCRVNHINLMMVDHHPTNKLHEKYSWVHMSQPINGVPVSAAVTLAQLLNNETCLQFKYYHTLVDFIADTPNLTTTQLKFTVNQIYSYIITTISRYDTWEWKNHPWEGNREDYVSIMLNSHTPIQVLDHIEVYCIKKQLPYSNEMEKLSDEYHRAIENKFNGLMIDKLIVPMKFHGYNTQTYIGMDGRSNINSIKEKLLCHDDDTQIVMYIDLVARKIELRSNSDDVPVNTIAVHYGGGGHVRAAGASNIPARVFTEDILTKYYKYRDFYINKPLDEPDFNMEVKCVWQEVD